MTYELITDEEYASLPEGDEARFAAFEAICRARMTELVTQSRNSEADHFLRMQYMNVVAGAADALGVSGIEYPSYLDNPSDGLDSFMLSVSRKTAAIRLLRSSFDAYSVRLAQGTRGRIEQQIQRLRRTIMESDLPEAKRSALFKRLDQLSMELSQTRVSYAKVAAILTAVSCGIVVKGTDFLAEAPHAIATIHSLLGQDKESEGAAVRRLAPPAKPKALPAPGFGRSQPAKPQAHRMSELMDDDIPF